VVYNPETALKLREAAGETIGVNMDPSHLFWQGIDVPTAIRRFGQAGALFHVHAKDTFIDPRNMGENGCLDAKPYTQMRDRSWYFRSVGWGNDLLQWRQIVSALRLAGYDYVLSIEHEDGLASVDEGLRYAVEFLRQVLLREAPAEMWWA
jgi:sugar phosphate isomerase/epimerase